MIRDRLTLPVREAGKKMIPNTVHALKFQLFSGAPATVFAILDGASVPDLPAKLASLCPEHICLFRGDLEPDMAEVAPYLAILEKDAPFTDWVLSNGWGKHWCIFGSTPARMPALRKHFRRFLTVYDEAGNSRYFRYYDPRVLRVCLPECSPVNLQIIFGPVSWYLMEDVEPRNGRKFLFINNALREDKMSVG